MRLPGFVVEAFAAENAPQVFRRDLRFIRMQQVACKLKPGKEFSPVAAGQMLQQFLVGQGNVRELRFLPEDAVDQGFQGGIVERVQGEDGGAGEKGANHLE